MINYIMYLNKIKNTDKEKTLKLLNKIDAEIMTQRIFANIYGKIDNKGDIKLLGIN